MSQSSPWQLLPLPSPQWWWCGDGLGDSEWSDPEPEGRSDGLFTEPPPAFDAVRPAGVVDPVPDPVPAACDEGLGFGVDGCLVEEAVGWSVLMALGDGRMGLTS